MIQLRSVESRWNNPNRNKVLQEIKTNIAIVLDFLQPHSD